MAGFRVLATGLGFTEGPVWTRDERLLVTSISHGVVYEVADGGARDVAETGGGPNGLAEGADGLLYVAQNGANSSPDSTGATSPAAPGIQVIDGESVRHLIDGLGAPNDLCFGPDGRLYFTDPRGWTTPAEVDPGRVYALALDGTLELLTEGLKFTNGIAFGPDASQLFVAETFANRVLVYPFSNGRLGGAREFCRIDPGMPDGLCFDEDGLLYVAATSSEQVQVFDRDGRCIERLHCGEGSLPTNCCFGGAFGHTLFVTDSRGERVLAFERDAAGLALYPFR